MSFRGRCRDCSIIRVPRRLLDMSFRGRCQDCSIIRVTRQLLDMSFRGRCRDCSIIRVPRRLLDMSFRGRCRDCSIIRVPRRLLDMLTISALCYSYSLSKSVCIIKAIVRLIGARGGLYDRKVILVLNCV